jgi:DNA-binding transcriptional MerR regulator
MQISDLARRCAVNVQTIRYYERIGLLPRAMRGANGYRVYGAESARAVQFVRQAQSLGFSLEECRQILDLRRHHKRPCDEVIRMSQAHLDRVEGEILRLRRFQKRLKSLLVKWRARGPQPDCSAAICEMIEGAFPPPLDMAVENKVKNLKKKGVAPCAKHS